MPKAVLYKVTSTAATAIGSASAAWTSTAAYHTGVTLSITVAPASTTISGAARYVVALGNEGGADSTGTVKVKGIFADVTCDTASGGADFTFWL
jgi:hypothetical protein